MNPINADHTFDTNKLLNDTFKDSDLNFQIFDLLPTAIYVCNMEGYVVYFNKAAAEVWGSSPALNVDKWGYVKEIRNLDNRILDFEEGPMALAVKKQIESKNFELIFIRKDDKQLHVISNTKVVKNKKGEQIGALNMLVDITQQVANENTYGRLKAIADTCTDAIVSVDLQGIVTSWNNAAHVLSGVSEEEAVGKNVAFFIPEGSMEEYRDVQSRILAGEKVVRLESLRNHKNGKEVQVALSVSPILDRGGNLIGISSIARDMTDIQLAMHKESILAAIVDGSDDTILSKTLEGIITSWNPAAERMFGYKEKEVVGKHISILIPFDRLNEEEHIINAIKTGNRIEHFETIRITKSGKELPISLTISPIFNKSGDIIGASKIARDITLKKKMLRENLRYIKSLESINSIAKNVSKELNINNILQIVLNETTFLTGALYGTFAYKTTDDSENADIVFAFAGTNQEQFERLNSSKTFYPKLFTNKIIRSGDITQDPRYHKLKPFRELPDTGYNFKSYLSIPVKKTDETVIGAIILAHPDEDIFTIEHEIILVAVAAQAAISIDNARLYEEVKMLNEKKDEFIGLASHELKTPLTSISGYLQILGKILQEEKHKYFLDKTVGIVKKLTDLVNDILDISKITAGKLTFSSEAVNISDTITGVVELMNFSQQTHKIHYSKSEKDLVVLGDNQRLEQVLINLLSNAIKYGPESRDIYITLDKKEQQALITIQDFGIGMSEDKLQHIFSRFYRIEGQSKGASGLGIGLYITQQIVIKHGGTIWVKSKPNEGSTFYISLPLSKN